MCMIIWFKFSFSLDFQLPIVKDVGYLICLFITNDRDMQGENPLSGAVD